MADTGTCRGCGQEVRWVKMHPSGKANPLNPDADPERGNIVICDDPEDARTYDVPLGRALTLGREVAIAERLTGETELYLSHFATCPKRERFKS